MRADKIFFWATCCFLLGVLLASMADSWALSFWLPILIGCLIVFVILFLGKPLPALLAVFIVIGAGYYAFYDFYQKDEVWEFTKPIVINGIVREVKSGLSSQKLKVGEIQITTSRYPIWDYGDEVRVEGVIKKVPDEWRGYFAKEDIFGLMNFPKITLVAKNQGSPLKAALLKLNIFIRYALKKVLPPEKAAFMTGLIIGETSEFSPEFKDKLRLTGTAHLVALSGYNIAVIASAAAMFFSFWLSRRWSFVLTMLVILAFVIMTGAESSVVRAAIMGFILLLANQVGQQYFLRNTLAAAALIMVLVNPKVLVFDIGFQLSFAAVLGIAYLRPWLQKILHMSDDPGVFSWRSNFLTTTAAQLAVLPIILANSGSFSFLSIFSNILILEVIPLTMTLGFLIVGASIFSYHLALIIGLIAQVFLGYILGIIDIFARLNSLF